MCALMGRSLMPDATTVQFQRANGFGGCANQLVDAVEAQRVQLPVGSLVTAVPLSLAAGALSGVIPVSFDLTRTALLTSSQASGGQAGGETASNTSIFGEAQVRLSCDGAANTCTAFRASAASTAVFTIYALQLDPR